MGNVFVGTLVLSIFGLIGRILWRQYQTSGSLCSSCTRCPIKDASTTSTPQWVMTYRTHSISHRSPQ